MGAMNYIVYALQLTPLCEGHLSIAFWFAIPETLQFPPIYEGITIFCMRKDSHDYYNSCPCEEHLADEAEEDEKTAYYKPQLEIYAKALQAIYHKPVAGKNLVSLRTCRQVSC